MRLAILILVLLLGVAHAEDVASYEVDGESDAGGADPRVAALDDAFGRAVTAALKELLPGNLRTQHKQVLDREVVGRARLWVVKFTVASDETNDDRRQLTVAVRVDRDKMRTRLAELGIDTSGGNGGPAPAQPVAVGRTRPIAVALRVVDPEVVRATYGVEAAKDLPGLGVVAGALRGAGFAARPIPSTNLEVNPGGELPLDDTEAEGLANDAKVDAILVAGVTIGKPVAVRGVATDAVLVTAVVRVVDVKQHKATGQGRASVAALTREQVSAAVERALRGALADALPPQTVAIAPPTSFKGADTPVESEGVVLVRLPAKTSLALVLAEQKYLLGAKGVTRVAIRRLSPGGWIIGVTTNESVDKIASIAKKPPLKDTRVSVKVVNNIVEVALAGGS